MAYTFAHKSPDLPEENRLSLTGSVRYNGRFVQFSIQPPDSINKEQQTSFFNLPPSEQTENLNNLIKELENLLLTSENIIEAINSFLTSNGITEYDLKLCNCQKTIAMISSNPDLNLRILNPTHNFGPHFVPEGTSFGR